jgi:threonine 3-dehydrogenase
MKALVKKEAAPGMWLEDVPEPELGISDVLIKIKRTAICGRLGAENHPRADGGGA